MDVVTDASDEAALDYHLSAITGSRLQVRGPLPPFDNPFIAVLGGIETFGKYVATPFPALLAEETGLPVANLGVAQAGLSLFSEEQVLLDIASKAQLTVLQVLGAQNMSNRLYRVHARRNDRFIGASPALSDLFPEVDFAEINFTGHLITTLREASSTGYRVLVDELKWAWVQRMRRVLNLIRGDVLLLWVADHPPVDAGDPLETHEPHFIDTAMLADIRDASVGLVEVVLEQEATLDGKVFPSQDAEAALQLPGLSDHRKISDALAKAVAVLANGSGGGLAAAGDEDQSFSISSGTAVKRSATRP